ncbi:M61 family metallopeptidase [Piscinibacter terrae]|uniref:M61 family peptidase n=1 Tax=Piscinibacter terrae TaxID=2496871 RepID=A0A3N7JJR9_9BURK|nr:PDZ domain-containing protein [Albitalea terrae]RQP21589.1 M61 family peptidase [Albitalea terrae]
MISYRIDIADANAHLFRVMLTIPNPAERQILSLPVWIPGSYLVREFSRHVSELKATQAGNPVALDQLDKATWEATCSGKAPLVLRYLVYAFDTSVRTAFLNAQRGFFNGTSLCLRAEGREDEAHEIELVQMPEGWEVATGMGAVTVDALGRGTYRSADYDELVDHPFELGRFWRGRFEACGVPHEFVVAGAFPDFDGERLVADSKTICEAAIKFWHGSEKPPFDRYVFMLNAVDEGYGGLEHRASTALIDARRNLPQKGKAELTDGYVTLMGLISHEYFHTWNVKRLKPREFAPYDFTRENYTELLWFFEGFTSYYDDLLLVRAGLIDEGRYLKLVAKTISGVADTPGRKVQSVAQASFDAWVKYYRTDENTPNATISYYTKGSLVALALDLTLRSHQGNLDEVMRGLWARSDGGPISEADIRDVLREVGGRSFDEEMQAFVHGTGDLPLQSLLERVGVQWQSQAPTVPQRLGLRVNESALTGVRISHVLRGGAAERAGASVGDEVLAVDDWRIRRLDDLQRVTVAGGQARLMVSRDQRVLHLPLALPKDDPAQGAVSLTADAKAQKPAQALRKAWLTG